MSQHSAAAAGIAKTIDIKLISVATDITCKLMPSLTLVPLTRLTTSYRRYISSNNLGLHGAMARPHPRKSTPAPPPLRQRLPAHLDQRLSQQSQERRIHPAERSQEHPYVPTIISPAGADRYR